MPDGRALQRGLEQSAVLGRGFELLRQRFGVAGLPGLDGGFTLFPRRFQLRGTQVLQQPLDVLRQIGAEGGAEQRRRERWLGGQHDQPDVVGAAGDGLGDLAGARSPDSGCPVPP